MTKLTNNLPGFMPDWPAPARVRAWQTIRAGGVSPAPYDSLNLGDHVGDRPENVQANRASLLSRVPAVPCWLNQVHGSAVVDADQARGIPEADAAVARQAGTVCAIMTADCLPVLLCDRQGRVVGAAHGGWRSLAGGILENTVAAMQVAPGELMAWLGPAIGPDAFQVGPEVRDIFRQHDPAADSAFKADGSGKYLADIYRLARQRLQALGVKDIYGGNCCTVSQSDRFFSYRRDGVCGRMATLIWLAPDA
jgi:YfiH family protein